MLLDYQGKRLRHSGERQIEAARQRLTHLSGSPFLRSPLRPIQEKRLLLENQGKRLLHGQARRIETERQHLARLAASMDAMSPFRVLARGYSITQKDSGAVVSTIEQVAVGEDLKVRLQDGVLSCTTQRKEKLEWKRKR